MSFSFIVNHTIMRFIHRALFLFVATLVTLIFLSMFIAVNNQSQSFYNENLLQNIFSPLVVENSPVTSVGYDADEESFKLGIIKATIQLYTERLSKIPIMPIKPSKVKRILLVAKCRSGSSFLAQLIHSSPGVFYSFEPLHFLQYYQPKPEINQMELIRSIFRCQFSEDYLRHINDREKGDFMSRNRRVWDACQHDPDLCLRPNFVQSLCLRFPVQLIKEVRLTLNQIEQDGLLLDDAENEWKLIYLTRDPRAIMASRANFPWCQEDRNCSDARVLCGEQENDLSVLKYLQAQYPDRYYLLKHEDLSLNVESETEKLFAFLGLPITASVRVFLETHTKRTVGAEDPYSIRRHSENVTRAWRERLTPENIADISAACSSVLKTLNYST